jgi:hypothetical protein
VVGTGSPAGDLPGSQRFDIQVDVKLDIVLMEQDTHKRQFTLVVTATTLASRRAVVRWSDGTEGEALRYYDDEVLISEGDLIGKTQDEIRTLHFRRDRDWLRS